MITEAEMYWLTRLNYLRVLPLFLATPLIIAGIVMWLRGEEPLT